MLGVVSNRYPLELVAAWFASGGIIIYVATVWYFVFSGTPTRLQQAAYLTALFGFYLFRLADCSAHAEKQRAIHEKVRLNTGPVIRPDA